MSAPTRSQATSLDDQLATLRRELDQAQRAAVRAEGQRDAAQAQAENARVELQRVFGVDTVEHARAMLAELEAELASAVTECRTALDESGS